MLICSLCMALLLTGCDSLKYKKGVDAQEAGNYANAVEIFSELGEYKDSKNRISQCNYIIAQQEMEQGNYAEAIALFEVLGDYEDSVSLEKQCALDYGKALFGASDFAKAREQFNKAEKTDEVERYLRISAWEMLRTYVENSGPITKEDESTELIDSKTTIDNYTLTSRQGSIMILAENAEKSNRKEYGFYLRISKSISTTFFYDVMSDCVSLKSQFVYKQENNVGVSDSYVTYKGNGVWNIQDFHAEGDSRDFVQDVEGDLQYDSLYAQQVGVVVFLQEQLPKTGLGITVKDLGFINF